METKQVGVRLEQALISIIGDTWEISFLLYLISFTEVNGLPNRPHIQFIGEFGIRSGSPYEAAKKGSLQKGSINSPSQHHLQVCDPTCSATRRTAARQALSERKMGFCLFFPPVNKCRHIFIILAAS